MDLETLTKFRDTLNKECEDTLLKKGEAYTRRSKDRLKNFKEVSKNLGLTPLIAWSVYWHKHIDAIMFYLKTGQEGPEGIRENFKDARNYLDLGLALIDEQSRPPSVESNYSHE